MIYKKGFTLLELLIVVLLLGMVVAITVTALNSARNKGRDAGIIGNLSGIRQNAESVYLEDGNYNRVCGINGSSQETIITRLITASEVDSPTGVGSSICAYPAFGNAEAWAVSVALATEGYWCVDVSGFSGKVANGLDHEHDTSCY